eukprot:4761607-Pleurochrysis_carterae.AAC.2
MKTLILTPDCALTCVVSSYTLTQAYLDAGTWLRVTSNFHVARVHADWQRGARGAQASKPCFLPFAKRRPHPLRGVRAQGYPLALSSPAGWQLEHQVAHVFQRHAV